MAYEVARIEPDATKPWQPTTQPIHREEGKRKVIGKQAC